MDGCIYIYSNNMSIKSSYLMVNNHNNTVYIYILYTVVVRVIAIMALECDNIFLYTSIISYFIRRISTNYYLLVISLFANWKIIIESAMALLAIC